MKERALAGRIRTRLEEPNPLIQVIVGPRQVGKTTALKSALAGRGVYETADSPVPLPASVIEQWWAEASKDPTPVLAIDEIQKIFGWTEMVKRLWDNSERRRIKLLVTGSSALILEKGLKETLAGRYELLHADHWNFEEANEIFGLGLKAYLEFGCYPGGVTFLNNIERWGAYIRDSIIEPAIGRDLLQLHPVDQPALLRQLFGLAVTLPAQIISLNKLQGQLQGKGTLPTLQHYLRLLGGAFLTTGVEKFSRSAFRTRTSTQKLIIHDNGIIRAFDRPILQALPPEKMGHLFENAVGARFIEAGWDTFYWKDRDNEVDFVVLGPQGEKWAVEVKTAPVSEKELSGLKAFHRIHPEFEMCLLSLADQKGFQGIKNLDPTMVLSLRRKF